MLADGPDTLMRAGPVKSARAANAVYLAVSNFLRRAR